MGKRTRSATPAVTLSDMEAPGWIARAERATESLNAACDRAEALLKDVRGCQGDMSAQLRETKNELALFTGTMLRDDVQKWMGTHYEEVFKPVVMAEIHACSSSVKAAFGKLKNLLLFGNEEGNIGEFNVPGVIYQIVVDRENGDPAVITNAHPDEIGKITDARKIMPGIVVTNGK